jgi:hypothetical protein
MLSDVRSLVFVFLVPSSHFQRFLKADFCLCKIFLFNVQFAKDLRVFSQLQMTVSIFKTLINVSGLVQVFLSFLQSRTILIIGRVSPTNQNLAFSHKCADLRLTKL